MRGPGSVEGEVKNNYRASGITVWGDVCVCVWGGGGGGGGGGVVR